MMSNIFSWDDLLFVYLMKCMYKSLVCLAIVFFCFLLLLSFYYWVVFLKYFSECKIFIGYTVFQRFLSLHLAIFFSLRCLSKNKTNSHEIHVSFCFVDHEFCALRKFFLPQNRKDFFLLSSKTCIGLGFSFMSMIHFVSSFFYCMR